MSRIKVLQLYKNMLKESMKFTDYNFRNHALERIKYGFHKHRDETNPAKISSLIKRAEENYEILKRQVIIGQLYGAEKHLLDK